MQNQLCCKWYVILAIVSVSIGFGAIVCN